MVSRSAERNLRALFGRAEDLGSLQQAVELCLALAEDGAGVFDRLLADAHTVRVDHSLPRRALAGGLARRAPGAREAGLRSLVAILAHAPACSREARRLLDELRFFHCALGGPFPAEWLCRLAIEGLRLHSARVVGALHPLRVRVFRGWRVRGATPLTLGGAMDDVSLRGSELTELQLDAPALQHLTLRQMPSLRRVEGLPRAAFVHLDATPALERASLDALLACDPGSLGALRARARQSLDAGHPTRALVDLERLAALAKRRLLPEAERVDEAFLRAEALDALGRGEGAPQSLHGAVLPQGSR